MLKSSLLLACLVPAAGQAATRDITQWRCRNRKLSCKKWAVDNQCTANYPFMAEECPAACNLCTNAGLAATPAAFELDYVCRGKLQPFPAKLQEAAHTPDGCDFHCRDNMTVCVQEAARDACKTHPEVMRVQCPATCGVCKALGLRVSTETEYPKSHCEDATEQAAACAGWAAKGECIKNHPFMSQMCGRSCGLCGAAVATEKPAAAAAADTKKRGKKSKKKSGKPDAGSPVEAEVAQQAGAERGRGGAIPGGGDGAEQAKRGFVSGVKAALGKVGDAFKGSRGKTADKKLPKVEL